MGANRYVLFVSHDASRTGATLVLLHFLQWLKQSRAFQFGVLLRRSGPLRGEFADTCSVVELESTYGFKARARAALANPAALRWQRPIVDVQELRRSLDAPKIDLVYSNTVTNGLLLRDLSAVGAPLLTHVHELEQAIGMYAPGGSLDLTWRHSSRYIATSRAVQRHLCGNYGIQPQLVDVVHPFIRTRDWTISQSPSEVRQQLGIAASARVVGAIGTVEWRKGADLFVLLAAAVKNLQINADVHFVWIGGYETATLKELLHDARNAGVADRVHFIGPQPEAEVMRLIGAFDVFCLPSREEPFGIVMLEAACHGQPSVCFDDAGGAPEFVEDDCGFVVPYLDVHQMAQRIIELTSSRSLCARMGEAARSKAFARHDIDIGAPQICERIERLMDQRA